MPTLSIGTRTTNTFAMSSGGVCLRTIKMTVAQEYIVRKVVRSVRSSSKPMGKAKMRVSICTLHTNTKQEDFLKTRYDEYDFDHSTSTARKILLGQDHETLAKMSFVLEWSLLSHLQLHRPSCK